MYQLKVTRKIGVPDYVDAQAKDLLIKLLDRNPNTRMTDPKKIKGHNWFTTIDWDKLYNKEIDPPFIPKTISLESTENIDPLFLKKDVQVEIGSVDELGIDDTADPKFTDFSYFPPDLETSGGSAVSSPNGKSTTTTTTTTSTTPTPTTPTTSPKRENSAKEEVTITQPNSSFVWTNPAEGILEAHGLGRVPRVVDVVDSFYDGLGNENDD